MIDFHTHTFLSDGALNPSELVRRAFVKGYRAIGLTDHADASNLDFLVPRIVRVAKDLNQFQECWVAPGVELTHVPPGRIPALVAEARRYGAVLVLVHGESPVEPVAAGTNRAAIESGVDILAHPGHISEADAQLAGRNGVLLEISCRHGHSFTNGHVARMAKRGGASLVVNTDAHTPDNLVTRETALGILTGAGLQRVEAEDVLRNNEELLMTLKRGMESR